MHVDEIKKRAERLKRLRNMANLSRQEICSEDMNFYTYKGWEIGRHGGITEKGAQKVISRIAESGVICSLDWLLHGKGAEPYIPKEMAEKNEEFSSLNENFKAELNVFQGKYPNAVFFKIKDSSFSPNFKQGDVVAGVKLLNDRVKEAVGKLCIVKIKNSPVIVRRLIKEKKGGYILIPGNTESEETAVYDPNIEFVAPITRHYMVN